MRCSQRRWPGAWSKATSWRGRTSSRCRSGREALNGRAAATFRIWLSSASFELKAASAAAASLIVTPYLFAYDMAALVIPGAFLTKELLERGGPRYERVAVFGLFCGLFAMFAGAGVVPVGPIVNLALFSLIVSRAFRGSRLSAATSIADP
jgi:hypothetical protein